MEKFIITDFHKPGKRENNEDSIYPNHSEEYPQGIVENLFMVCDGMGGHQKGEIASDMICTQMSKYFIDNKIETSDAETVKKAVAFVESKFDSYITDFEESAGMGSTMTMVHFHEKGATVAHVGDSRIYVFRDGKIIYKTKDHSRVQQYLDSGVLETEDEARNHAEKNVILQAIRGASLKATKPDIEVITDLKENDVFLLCTDGVIESLTDSDIIEIFATMPNIEAITAKIVRICNENSSDNFSGILLQLLPGYINSLKIDKVEELSAISSEKAPIENQKTMTRLVATSTEEVSKANEEAIPNTKTQITEPTEPDESASNLDKSEIENPQNFISDIPSKELQETIPKEEENKQEEKPLIQASPASDYQENKTSANIGNTPKSQVIPKKNEVANPIYESSKEENKPNFMKFLLFGIVGVVLAVVAYYIINKKVETTENNPTPEKITQVISEIKEKEDRKIPLQSSHTNNQPAPPATSSSNNSSSQPTTSDNSTTNTQLQIENKIKALENFIQNKNKRDAERLLKELKYLGISQDEYNSLKNKFNQKFNNKTQNGGNSDAHVETNKKEDINNIIKQINSINTDDPDRARQVLNNYKKYKDLQVYKDKDDFLNKLNK